MLNVKFYPDLKKKKWKWPGDLEVKVKYKC